MASRSEHAEHVRVLCEQQAAAGSERSQDHGAAAV